MKNYLYDSYITLLYIYVVMIIIMIIEFYYECRKNHLLNVKSYFVHCLSYQDIEIQNVLKYLKTLKKLNTA